MHELLHPPGHRGPVIAAGAVLLTVGVALQQLRMDWSPAVQFLILAVLAAAARLRVRSSGRARCWRSWPPGSPRGAGPPSLR